MTKDTFVTYDKNSDSTFVQCNDGTWKRTSGAELAPKRKARPTVEIMPYEAPQAPQMAQQAQQRVSVSTSYRDRAEAHVTAHKVPAMVTALAVSIGGCLWLQTPFLSFVTVALACIGFLLYWSVMWFAMLMVSTEGMGLLQILLGYRVIRHEQKFRQKLQRDMIDYE